MMPRNNEQRYYDALKRITQYQSVERMRKHSDKDWGLSFEEALAGAYENVIYDAKYAIRRRKRPVIVEQVTAKGKI
jgi:hypothetical protein